MYIFQYTYILIIRSRVYICSFETYGMAIFYRKSNVSERNGDFIVRNENKSGTVNIINEVRSPY